MRAIRTAARGLLRPLAANGSRTVSQVVLRYVILAIVDAFALAILYALIDDQVWPLAIMLVVVTVFANVVNIRENLYPFRWMSPGLVLMALFVLYPLIFTVYTAFTNYSTGHLLTKAQTIELIEKRRYLPEGAGGYKFALYRSESGEFALWLTGEDGSTKLALPGQPIEEARPGEGIVGAPGEDGAPVSLEGYARVDRLQVIRFIPQLESLDFGVEPDTVRVAGLDTAAGTQQRYVYDGAQDAFIDRQTGLVYRADGVRGVFVAASGEELIPGFQVWTGFDNFARLLGDPTLRGPLVTVFIWTVVFAFVSVFSTFSLGLFMALIFGDPRIPGMKLIRSLLIIPYAIPGVISVLIWRGMLNPNLGVINKTIGVDVPWFADPGWAKVGILLINLWLGYSYFFLVNSGALAALPTDIYEAAKVDGANAWQRFWNITLPLLLVNVGPLLIASYTFNFNNFVIIYAYNQGNPPIPNTTTPAGYTDILISYTYRVAFGSGRGQDLGYAAAIATVIFLVVAGITLFQYRFTRSWEEVAANV
jgi:arabinogalactan oligomer/maltooligosaccharide transport system permease protein